MQFRPLSTREATFSGGTTLSIAKSPEIQPTDLMFAVLWTRSTVGAQGWECLECLPPFFIYWRTAGPSDGDHFDFTNVAGGWGGIFAYAKAQVASSQATLAPVGADGAYTAAGLQTSLANPKVLVFFSGGDCSGQPCGDGSWMALSSDLKSSADPIDIVGGVYGVFESSQPNVPKSAMRHALAASGLVEQVLLAPQP
jgi:hypothetical protein